MNIHKNLLKRKFLKLSKAEFRTQHTICLALHFSEAEGSRPQSGRQPLADLRSRWVGGRSQRDVTRRSEPAFGQRLAPVDFAPSKVPEGRSPSGIASGSDRTKHQTSIKISIKRLPKGAILLGRPLIKFSRFECYKFCEFWNLPIYPDFTNLNINSCRNRLRLQLIPYLKYFFNRNLNKKITQIQRLINLENQYFKTITQKIIFSKTEALAFPKILRLRISHTFLNFLEKSMSEINKLKSHN